MITRHFRFLTILSLAVFAAAIGCGKDAPPPPGAPTEVPSSPAIETEIISETVTAPASADPASPSPPSDTTEGQ